MGAGLFLSEDWVIFNKDWGFLNEDWDASGPYLSTAHPRRLNK
jgi:hypothetical protein